MKFTKMHGLGNDFLLFEDDGTGRDWNALAPRLCERRLGVGGDGLLILLPSKEADICMRIINADGSEAEMCGNGIRCFAKYAYERGIVKKTDMTVETLAGVMRPRLKFEGNRVTGVTVDMGKPSFDRADIPMRGEGRPFDVSLEAAGQTVVLSSVLMGVPHAVVVVDEIDAAEVSVLGPAIERHMMFPRKTNVNFVKILGEKDIRVLTWERGAALTMACGTGACASVVALNEKGLTGPNVTVHLEAGRLEIERLDDGRVMMTGPAEEVFTAVLSE